MPARHRSDTCHIIAFYDAGHGKRRWREQRKVMTEMSTKPLKQGIDLISTQCIHVFMFMFNLIEIRSLIYMYVSTCIHYTACVYADAYMHVCLCMHACDSYVFMCCITEHTWRHTQIVGFCWPWHPNSSCTVYVYMSTYRGSNYWNIFT